jgi:hypothetical protein
VSLNNEPVDLAAAIGFRSCLGNCEPNRIVGGLLGARQEDASMTGQHTREALEPKPRTRVAIYARFSSEMQSPRSIEDQIREC